jgi:hypothetical protein
VTACSVGLFTRRLSMLAAALTFAGVLTLASVLLGFAAALTFAGVLTLASVLLAALAVELNAVELNAVERDAGRAACFMPRRCVRETARADDDARDCRCQ